MRRSRGAGLISSLRTRKEARPESGFTLIEILVALGLLSVLLALSVGALRHFWLTRSLSGAGDEVITQLRSTQEKVVSESFPLVYGVRFDVGTNDWYVVKFDPVDAGAGDDTCEITESNEFAGGVKVQTASFDIDSYITGFCGAQTGAPASAAFALFYPRGYATPGNVVLEQPLIGKTKGLSVAALTGRVSEQ